MPLPKHTGSQAEQLEGLLANLCDEWGFCLPSDKAAAITSRSRIDARTFALEVLKTQGFDKPETETQWIRRIKRRFVQQFGDIVVGT
jgi:hypothetical protein